MTRDRLLEQAIELLAIADFHSLTLKEERNQVVREGIELLRQPKPDQNELQEPVCPDCKAKQRKPLTDEQRKDLMNKAWDKWLGGKDDNHLFAWHFSVEVEAAHDIKEGA